jgi:hypothetical protein
MAMNPIPPTGNVPDSDDPQSNRPAEAAATNARQATEPAGKMLLAGLIAAVIILVALVLLA